MGWSLDRWSMVFFVRECVESCWGFGITAFLGEEG